MIAYHDAHSQSPGSNDQIVADPTVSFDPKTGEIYDVDIELDTGEHDFALSGAVAPVMDLNAVLTHQAGHFLGLAHSAVPDATMSSIYNPGMVTLDADDISAICAAYPPDRVAASDSDEPRTASPANARWVMPGLRG